MIQAPTFPPLLKGHRIASGKSPLKHAKAHVLKGEFSAGDLIWSDDQYNLRFALVLEPEVDVSRCGEMLYVAMVAFGDAAGTLCPPEVAINYQWPNVILLNEAQIGLCGLALSETSTAELPDWMIVSLDISMKPEKFINDPGEEAWRTTMWDEGCGDISRTQLLESTSRHLLNWIHTWSEEGFKPIHDQWVGRFSKDDKLISGLSENEYLGLDESGNALVKFNDEMRSLDTIEVLGNSMGSFK